MKKETITEGNAKIDIYTTKIVSKELPVFYNPVMKYNRDTTIWLLNNVANKEMQIGSPLAGSGVREARMMLELKKGKIKNMQINDFDKTAVSSIKNNFKINKIDSEKNDIKISTKDANDFLLSSEGFDYIDIDPFGSPNPFLDSAAKRISRNGILAVTATDTAPLAGTYPAACKRKYFATPLRNEHEHEIGLRILIRKVQLIGVQYDKALIPIFSYFKDHYFRIFFSCIKSKEECDKVLHQHKYFLYCPKCTSFETSTYNEKMCCGQKMIFAGPIWAGELSDTKLLSKMLKSSKDNFIKTCLDESKIKNVGYYDIHRISKKYGLEPRKMEHIMSALKDKGSLAERTHFTMYGIKTDANLKDIMTILKEKNNK